MKKTIKRIIAAIAVIVWVCGLLSMESLAERLTSWQFLLAITGLFAVAFAAVPVINKSKIFD